MHRTTWTCQRESGLCLGSRCGEISRLSRGGCLRLRQNAVRSSVCVHRNGIEYRNDSLRQGRYYSSCGIRVRDLINSSGTTGFRMSRFCLSESTSEILLTVIRSVCRAENPLSCAEAESILAKQKQRKYQVFLIVQTSRAVTEGSGILVRNVKTDGSNRRSYQSFAHYTIICW